MLMTSLCIFLVFFTSLGQVWTIDSLNDYPLVLDDGDLMLHATVTDLNSKKKFFIQEFIHSTARKYKGRISISPQSSSLINVYYVFGLDNQRVVMQDYDCQMYTYRSKWDLNIPSVSTSLLNHVLLVGPSLIYRLKDRLTWTPGTPDVIRGVPMNSVKSSIAKTLEITYYYKDIYTSYGGLSHPSRIILTGSDPSNPVSYGKENILIDIYLQNQLETPLDAFVSIQPGIGCPVPYSDIYVGKETFSLVGDTVHYISIETVDGPTKSVTKNEVYASWNQILSMRTIINGVETDIIHDYVLGLIYKKESDSHYSIFPMDKNAPGYDDSYLYNPLRINHLLGTDYEYRYLGRALFQNREGFEVDLWEVVLYNRTISSGTYDKLVVSMYTVDSPNADTDSSIIIVGQITNAYNKNSKNVYNLVERITKEYYDFGQEIPNDEYEERFRLEDCYTNPADRINLKIQFECEGRNCEGDVKRYFYRFRDGVRSAIIQAGPIASSRIGPIDIVLESEKIIAYVTLLNFPDINDAFKSENVRLSPNVFKSVTKFSAKNDRDCLKINSGTATTFEAIAYCWEDSSCARINKISDLVVDDKNGVSCTVHYIPLKNLYRYAEEMPLSEIKNGLSKKGLAFSLYEDYFLKSFISKQIDEVKVPEGENPRLFDLEAIGWNLVADDTNTVRALNITNYADCYRACANFDDNDCETFSYCEMDNKVECLLSTSIYANITDKRVVQRSCNIYRKKRLSDYVRIPNRAYVNPTSTGSYLLTDDCVDLCSALDECYSFQTCSLECTLGGHYTDASTKYSKGCSIYIPKVAKLFAPTGKKIVSKSYHSEFNVNLDQCAALCYNDDSDADCVSFNYCPKQGDSPGSCFLSQYSVNEPSVETIESTACTNYERIPEEEVKYENKKSQIESVNQEKGTNVGQAFGIIILFMTVGLVVGLIGPFGFKKSKELVDHLTSTESISWALHRDEEQEQTEI